ncbi:MazG-like family protein [Streptomyces capparidis]
MDDGTWKTIEQLRDWLDDASPVTGELALTLRIGKIGEEYGEAWEALHGVLGTNPRKGHSHTWEDLQTELADTAITALVALASSTPDAAKIFTTRLQEITDRSLR